MPSKTERQQATDAIYRAFLLETLVNLEMGLGDDLGVDSDSDSDTDSDSEDSDTSSSSGSSSSSDSDEDLAEPPPAYTYLNILGDLHSQCYLKEREPIEKADGGFHLLLDNYHFTQPQISHSYFRVSPETFNAIILAIQDDPIFHNNSEVPQAPVSDQLAVALYRFGHYGNAVSHKKVALWAGIGAGTVSLYTRRIMAACCSERFRSSSTHWPNEMEKERAKQWVEEQSCADWRNGWCMVDGTLIPLSVRPGLFGNTWFDRKSNYSMNVQVKYEDIYSVLRLISSRLSQPQTSVSLIMVLVFLEANMMLQPGRRHVFPKSILPY